MIYLDNAETSFPKPKNVLKDMGECMKGCCFSPRPEGNSIGRLAYEKLERARTNLAGLFGIENSRRLVFTSGNEGPINRVFNQILKPGDHVITTVYEHKFTINPLAELSRKGIRVTVLDGNINGEFSLSAFRRAIRPKTRLAAVSLTAGATGRILPLEEIGEACRENGVMLFVDASMGAGIHPINLKELDIDVMVFAGDKYLYGPVGTGGLYLGEKVLFEPGEGFLGLGIQEKNENLPLILGLSAGVDYINKRGMGKLRKHTEELCLLAVRGLSEIRGIKLLSRELIGRIPIVSLYLDAESPGYTASQLDSRYEIILGSGTQGYDLFHNMTPRLEGGTLRISPGIFNDKEEILKFVKAMQELALKK